MVTGTETPPPPGNRGGGGGNFERQSDSQQGRWNLRRLVAQANEFWTVAANSFSIIISHFSLHTKTCTGSDATSRGRQITSKFTDNSRTVSPLCKTSSSHPSGAWNMEMAPTFLEMGPWPRGTTESSEDQNRSTLQIVSSWLTENTTRSL